MHVGGSPSVELCPKREGSMDASIINPFLSAATKVLTTMAFTEPTPGKPYLRKPDESLSGDVAGVVGVTGEVSGSMVLSFSEDAILHIVSSMFGETFSELNGEVRDAVGELSNMICGDARGTLDEQGCSINAAVPTVIVGADLQISHQTKKPSVVIPFTVGESGKFFVDVCFE